MQGFLLSVSGAVRLWPLQLSRHGRSNRLQEGLNGLIIIVTQRSP